MAKQKLWQTEPWQSDEEFELLLHQSLAAIQPPADFSNRVMAAIQQEARSPQAEVIPFASTEPAPKRRFAPSFWPGLGTIAAGLVLFVWASLALPGDNSNVPGALPIMDTTNNVRVAENEPIDKLTRQDLPQTVEPNTTAEPTAPTTPEVSPQPVTTTNENSGSDEPTQPLLSEVPTNAEPNQTTEPAQTAELLEPSNEPPALPIEEAGAGELILPRAAFGTEAQGTLSVRLLAEVPDSQIYSPSINRRGSAASFYTADAENVYSWRVNLSTADSPEVTLVTSRSSIDDMNSLLTPTTTSCDATTLVASPDNTIMAQNSPNGLWISLAEGEVYSLSEEAGGSLLAWSPDSSKLLFTNSQGQLFMGYPLEKRIYQITDMPVKDICWSTDNQTIIFLANNNDQDALYIAELI